MPCSLFALFLICAVLVALALFRLPLPCSVCPCPVPFALALFRLPLPCSVCGRCPDAGDTYRVSSPGIEAFGEGRPVIWGRSGLFLGKVGFWRRYLPHRNLIRTPSVALSAGKVPCLFSNLPQISRGPSPNLPGTFPKSPRDLPQISRGPSPNLPGTFPKSPPDRPQKTQIIPAVFREIAIFAKSH